MTMPTATEEHVHLPGEVHDHAEHAHETGHDHSHGAGGSSRALLIALVLTSSFIVAEVVGGIFSNSLALLADAGHMVSDAAALALSLGAIWMASRPHNDRRTFGYHRAEILAALLNGVTLLAIAGYVIWEAIQRLQQPPEISSLPMLAVAVAGLAINLISLKILGGHNHGNINVRGAFLHVLGDALGSVGVIIGAIVIALTGWTPADAIVSILISVLIVVAGWRLVRETTGILLESSPGHIDTAAVRKDLATLPHVTDVHDLHIWTVTSGFVALSGHLDLAPGANADSILKQAGTLLRERYRIDHVTLQPETGPIHDDDSCCLDNHAPATATMAQLTTHQD